MRGFLKIDFRENRECVRYMDLCKKAERLLAAWNMKKAAVVIKSIGGCPFNDCYEYRLLHDRFLVRRNAKGDGDKALKDLHLLSMQLKRRERDCASMPARKMKYVLNFRAEVYEELANCLYYMERDAESLRVYRKLLLFAAKHSLRLGCANEVKNKVRSLEFMLSPAGFRCVVRHIRQGRFALAFSVGNRAVSSFGAGYLDHEALTMVSICNAEVGNVRRARLLMDQDYHFSPSCLQTRFFWALMNMFGAREKEAMRVIRGIANGNTRSSCTIGAAILWKMQFYSRLVSASTKRGRRLIVDGGPCKTMSLGPVECLRLGIWFVEVDSRNVKKLGDSRLATLLELVNKRAMASKRKEVSR